MRFAGAFADDLRVVREPLRSARHAIFHVGNDDAYYDARLFEPLMRIPDAALTIVRVHHGFARLLLEGLHARNAAEGDAPPT